MSRLELSLTSLAYGPTAVVPSGQTPSTIGFYSVVTNAKTFTVNSATPAVFTSPTPHGLAVNDQVVLNTLVGGTGLAIDTVYYVLSTGLTSTQFEVSTTAGGTALNTSSTGSGTFTDLSQGQTHTITMQPQRFGEEWTIKRIVVQSSSTNSVPNVRIYRGIISPVSVVDETAQGQQNTDDVQSPIHLNQGEPIIAVFTGVDPPTTAGQQTCVFHVGGDTNR